VATCGDWLTGDPVVVVLMVDGTLRIAEKLNYGFNNSRPLFF